MGLPTPMGAQTWLLAVSSLSESLGPLRAVELFACLFVCFSFLSQGLTEWPRLPQTQSPECWDYPSVPSKSPCSACWLLFFLFYPLQVRSDLGKYPKDFPLQIKYCSLGGSRCCLCRKAWAHPKPRLLCLSSFLARAGCDHPRPRR